MSDKRLSLPVLGEVDRRTALKAGAATLGVAAWAAAIKPWFEWTAELDVDSREVCIHRSNYTPVGDDDELPPPTCHDSGPGDSTGRRGRDGCTPPGGEVDSAVEAEPARPERRGDRRANRPREPDRAFRELRRLERADRLRSGDAVGCAAGPALVPDEGSLDVRLENAREQCGREAVPGKQELQLSHVPTRVPDA